MSRKADYAMMVLYTVGLDIRHVFRKIFGYCNYCHRYFVYPQKRLMNTMYVEEDSNYYTCCESCFEEIEKYWEESGEEYNNERGC